MRYVKILKKIRKPFHFLLRSYRGIFLISTAEILPKDKQFLQSLCKVYETISFNKLTFCRNSLYFVTITNLIGNNSTLQIHKKVHGICRV